MNREDQLLSAILRDKFRQCEKRSCHTWSGFLTPAEAAEAESVGRSLGADFVLEGGYEDAERRVAAFYAGEAPEPGDWPICALRLRWNARFSSPGHRDLLGAVMGLGIERETTGDIAMGEYRGEGCAYLFENRPYDGSSYNSYKCTIKSVEQRAGFDFFHNVQDEFESSAEQQTAGIL